VSYLATYAAMYAVSLLVLYAIVDRLRYQATRHAGGTCRHGSRVVPAAAGDFGLPSGADRIEMAEDARALPRAGEDSRAPCAAAAQASVTVAFYLVADFPMMRSSRRSSLARRTVCPASASTRDVGPFDAAVRELRAFFDR
jgi:hypothetical protein